LTPPYTFDHATPQTLAAYTDFVGTGETATANLRARLADGRLKYQHLCQMHSGRGMEAAWTDGPGPVLVPHLHPALEQVGLQVLAQHLAVTAAGKRVILDATFAPLADAPWLAAGWVLDSHAVIATTDLTAGRWPLDPRVEERPISELLAPDLLELYAGLLTVGKIGDTEETDPAAALSDDLTDREKRLFVLLEDRRVLAAAVLTQGERGAGIHLLGVHPEQRSRGLGRALHAHLLAVASETHARHVGATGYDNLAMRKIFTLNRARMVEQKQFVQAR